MKIAVIGSGVSGLTAAYLLSRQHDVHVLEKASRIGGHVATVDIEYNHQKYAIDTGFIVYNDRTYPNFIALLEHLGVASEESTMSFSVTCLKAKLEYAGSGLNAIFAQRKNIFSLHFWRMLKDIVRFNRCAERDLNNGVVDNTITLGQYLYKHKYSDAFCQHYLIPMGAAIWSASFSQMKQFPLLFFIRFFSNHGLLTIFDKPQWRVIRGGSKQYIKPLIEPFKDNVRTQVDIARVYRHEEYVKIEYSNGVQERFDHVVFATHSDQALMLLGDASDKERDILGAIRYQENSVVLHRDTSLLPSRRSVWSSWNYRLGDDESALPTLTYNMNILQNIKSDTVFCVSLNADSQIDEHKILGRYQYSHPQFNIAVSNAQARKHEINGHNRTSFCGAYWANGFHEDGVVSAIDVAKIFGLEAIS